MELPEGIVLLILLFGFPYLLARKGVFDVENIIHSYMAITEKHLIRFLQLIHHENASCNDHI